VTPAIVRARPGVTVAAAPGERGLRVLRAGVCGTDVQIARGVRDDVATILGHECVVEYAGDAYVLNPVDPRDQDRILGHSFDGAFRRQLPVDYLRMLPYAHVADRGVVADLAPLTEPLGAALYGLELAAAVTGPLRNVAVWGSGGVGWLLAAAAAGAGLSVTVVDPTPRRWAPLVTRLHAAGCDVSVAERAAEQDAAFLCLARPAAGHALPALLAAVRDGGAVDLLGGVGAGDTLPGTAVDCGALRRMNACGTAAPVFEEVTHAGRRVRVLGHRGTAVAHLAAAERLLLARPPVFAALVTRVAGLAEAARVVNALCRRDRMLDGDLVVKLVVDPLADPDALRTPDLGRRVGDLL
jgi:threonine dehydrogenase-like Zn-dependent dehydrogenase